MVLVELSIYPMDKGVHLSSFVARVVHVIQKSRIKYQLTSMGTIIEGEWAEVLRVVDACFKELDRDCDRIIVNLKADSKRGQKNLMESKVKSVEEKL